jgi:hypothetical protein
MTTCFDTVATSSFAHTEYLCLVLYPIDELFRRNLQVVCGSVGGDGSRFVICALLGPSVFQVLDGS